MSRLHAAAIRVVLARSGVVLCLAGFCVGARQDVAGAAVAPLAGRYRIIPGADVSLGGTVDIDPRRGTYTVNCHLETGKTLRGLGLSEGTDLVGASLYTGGVAHGLAIYRRNENGKVWHGRWITSIDSAATIGVMDIDTDPKQATLAGRHHFSGQRTSTGTFDGTVTLTPQGPDFLLSFSTSGGTTLYRGVGILRGDRLIVAWSFGSSPALAVYQAGKDGEVAGRRVSLRSRGTLDALDEHLLAADASLIVSGPTSENKAQRTKGGGIEVGGTLSAAEPSAPIVKLTNYNDLMSRYGNDGWAERWLRSQLTSDELRLLQLAVVRRGAADPSAPSIGTARWRN